MQTIESLKSKMESARDLQSVVRTMKALAAVSIRQYEKAVESLEDYNRTVELGLQIVLEHGPWGLAVPSGYQGGAAGIVAFGSDQGMCGQINTRMATHVLETVKRLEETETRPAVLAVGHRLSGQLEDSGVEIEGIVGLPGSVDGVTSKVQDILFKVEEWRFRRGVGRVMLLHHKPLSGSSYRAHTVLVFPVDPEWLRGLERKKWESRTLPMFTMEWRPLFASLVRQYIFVSIYRAFVESLASENAARLSSMQAAEKNIDERLDELSDLFHRRRQASITSELLDIVAGFEALTGGGSAGTSR